MVLLTNYKLGYLTRVLLNYNHNIGEIEQDISKLELVDNIFCVPKYHTTPLPKMCYVVT